MENDLPANNETIAVSKHPHASLSVAGDVALGPTDSGSLIRPLMDIVGCLEKWIDYRVNLFGTRMTMICAAWLLWETPGEESSGLARVKLRQLEIRATSSV
jgi:hypothetical protein